MIISPFGIPVTSDDFLQNEVNLIVSTSELRHSHLPASQRENTHPIETLTAGELERLEFLRLTLSQNEKEN